MIDNKKEYIICAAINYTKFECKDGSIGLIVCGRRHHDCINVFWNLSGIPTRRPNDIQGFMTSKNRFLDREEAAKLALEIGQIVDEDIEVTHTLISEDLY